MRVEALERYRQLQRRKRRLDRFGWVALGLTAVLLVTMTIAVNKAIDGTSGSITVAYSCFAAVVVMVVIMLVIWHIITWAISKAFSDRYTYEFNDDFALEAAELKALTIEDITKVSLAEFVEMHLVLAKGCVLLTRWQAGHQESGVEFRRLLEELRE